MIQYIQESQSMDGKSRMQSAYHQVKAIIKKVINAALLSWWFAGLPIKVKAR